MNSLDNHVALVTGAVGNLGAATARALAAAGARLVLADRSRDRLAQAFPELAGASEHLLVGDVDLSSAPSVQTLINAALARFGRIDALVNTVGAWRGGKATHEAPLDEWTLLFDANVRTTLLTCRAVIPQMLAQRRGRIVNVASRAALVGEAKSAAYAGAKAAVLRLTESLSAEVKHEGVNVNCVLPSTIDTPQNRAAMPTADHAKWVDPAAIADVVAFLVSDAARAIHGAAIPVYGRS